jgi:hypothetical protein
MDPFCVPLAGDRLETVRRSTGRCTLFGLALLTEVFAASQQLPRCVSILARLADGNLGIGAERKLQGKKFSACVRVRFRMTNKGNLPAPPASRQ